MTATESQPLLNQRFGILLIAGQAFAAQEIETKTDGMLIAIPEKEWAFFTQISSVELGSILLHIAAYVDLKKYKKNPRGPKIPRLERNQFKGHSHVSAAKLLKAGGCKSSLNDLKRAGLITRTHVI